MKGKKWLILLVSLATVLLASNIGVTRGYFVDLESSSGNTFQAWASRQWVQTTQADFDLGVLTNVASVSPGDVKLATSSATVTDTFNDETKLASKTNLIVSGGQVKLAVTSGTETLRPNAAGNSTTLSRTGGTANWDACSTSNGDTSYVWGEGSSWLTDLYNLSDVSLTGTINSVTVWIEAKRESLLFSPQASACTAIRIGSTNYLGTAEILTTSYATYSTTYTTKPGGGAWTWTEVNDLQAGVSLRSCSSLANRYSRCTYVRVVVDYSSYASSGTLTSVNLLSGKTVGSIDSFGYNASAIPSGTSLMVQFSQNNTNWYNSSGSLGGWDTLSQGTHSIGLGGLGWTGPNFYYRAQFTSDGTNTPVLDDISVNYSSYYTSGTIASQVLNTGVAGTRWDTLVWVEILQSNTDITFEVRASDIPFLKGDATPDWTNLGIANSPITSGLPSGWYMQWRATLMTSDTSKTPTLQEVRVSYH